MQLTSKNSVNEPTPITVMSSVPDPNGIAELILPQYELPRSAECTYFARGMHDTYRVDTEAQRFYLRVYRPRLRDEAAIRYELELLLFLKSKHFPAAWPMQTKDGRPYTLIDAPEGPRIAVLFIEAPGRSVGRCLTESQARALGMRVAEMHTLCKDFRTPHRRAALDVETLIDTPIKMLEPLLRSRPNDLALLQQIGTTLRRAVADLPRKPPLWGVCAGDIHTGNVHFGDDDDPTLFDFDQCGPGWRVFEVAKFLQYAFTVDLPSSVRTAFVSGYQSLRPLDAREIRLIPDFMQAAVIWMMGFRAALPEVVPRSTFSISYFDRRFATLRAIAGRGAAVLR